MDSTMDVIQNDEELFEYLKDLSDNNYEKLALWKKREDEQLFGTPEDCEDAIHGRRIPQHFTPRNLQLCVIRGIRHHFEFAQSMREALPAITRELKESPAVPFEFARASNARDIMSGVIPTLTSPEDTPYCIWHPDVPSKETLRALVQRYPYLLYHAARACAVGGYYDLYKEFDPLPEVHIAEEAGYAAAEIGHTGSQEIYQYILSQPIKYAIMNDYKRIVDIDGRRIAPLNGDTAVYSSLQAGWAYHHKLWNKEHYNFNITEDFCIDDHDHGYGLEHVEKTPDDYFPLLYSPLPADFPLVNKDKLLSVAAYNGEIDRYVRLRRPHFIEAEEGLVIHGIYNSPLFAKWWSSQIPECPEDWADIRIRRAINARRIMSNDITWVTADTPDELLPQCFWYPSFADKIVYQRLARIQPKLYKRCIRACIAAGYYLDWDELLLNPPKGVPEFKENDQPDDPELKSWRISRIVTEPIWEEARSTPEKRFLEDICAAVPGISENPPYLHHESEPQPWMCVPNLRHGGDVDFFFHDPVQPYDGGYGPYNGVDPDVGNIDLLLFTRDVLGTDAWEEELRNRGEDGYFRGPHDFLDIVQAIKASQVGRR